LVAVGGRTVGDPAPVDSMSVDQRARQSPRAVRTLSGFVRHALVLFGQNFSGSAALVYLGNDGESPDPRG
jgi:hypothetical protein